MLNKLKLVGVGAVLLLTLGACSTGSKKASTAKEKTAASSSQTVDSKEKTVDFDTVKVSQAVNSTLAKEIAGSYTGNTKTEGRNIAGEFNIKEDGNFDGTLQVEDTQEGTVYHATFQLSGKYTLAAEDVQRVLESEFVNGKTEKSEAQNAEFNKVTSYGDFLLVENKVNEVGEITKASFPVTIDLSITLVSAESSNKRMLGENADKKQYYLNNTVTSTFTSKIMQNFTTDFPFVGGWPINVFDYMKN